MQPIDAIIGYLISGGTFLLLTGYIAIRKDRSALQNLALVATTATTAWSAGFVVIPWLGLPMLILHMLEIAHIAGGCWFCRASLPNSNRGSRFGAAGLSLPWF